MENEYFYHAIPSTIDGNDIPLGMGAAFAQDLNALGTFVALSPEKQKQLIEHAHQLASAEEMQVFVSSIGSGSYS